MADSGERSEAERKAARLERERRRAMRLQQPDPEPDAAGPPSAASPDTSALEFEQEWDDSAVRTERRFDDGLDPDEPDESGELDVRDDEPGEFDAHYDQPGELDAHYDESREPDELDDEDELPSGTRRVAHRDRTAAGPAPRRGRRPRKPGRKHSIGGRVFALLAVLAALAAVWFLLELFQPFHSSGHAPVTVTIPPHSSASTIGKLLEHDGVISSGFFFDLRATLGGQRGDLRSGTYHLRQGMGYGDVLKILTTAPPAAKVSNLTIVEGKTRPEIDALLRSQKIRGSYLAASRHSRLVDPRRYGAPRSTNTLEGFLFPSTYQLRDPISITSLVNDQLQTFRQRFRQVNLSYARSKHLTPFDVLTIASMVQAEAQTAHDRPLIASVIYNRLASGMPLQIDATTRFATGNYTKPLTVSQLNSRSPYNTRLHKGLPPGPIDSPGLSAIQAAAHPARTNYLYFVVKPCGNGEHVFASTYSRFLAEARQYQTARTTRGGRSPAHC